MVDVIPAMQRQRDALRAEIQGVAIALFTQHGFDGTTIDQISSAAGVSRRTFFRYFGTKEDVLLGDLIARGQAIAASLAGRPREEDAWTALLESMREVRAQSNDAAAAELAIGRMMLNTPSLRARHLEKRLRWQELLVPLVATRVLDHDPVVAAAIVSTALSCLDVATDVYVASDGHEDLEAVFLRALAAVRA